MRFNTALTGLHTRSGALTGIETTAGPVPCEQMILAVGHSARDTFAMLHGLALPLECKPFSVGFRAEHLQTEIDKSLYHGAAGHPALPKGEYQLSQHVSGGRCVYTFCMCPGGTVCAACPARMFVPICTLSVKLPNRLDNCAEIADEATAFNSLDL